MDINLSKHWEIVKDGEAWHAVAHSQTWLSDWTTTKVVLCIWVCFWWGGIYLVICCICYISHDIIQWLSISFNAKSIHIAANSCGWEVFHCAYIPPRLHSFICWWTLEFLPYLGNYKICCCEHWDVHIFSN